MNIEGDRTVESLAASLTISTISMCRSIDYSFSLYLCRFLGARAFTCFRVQATNFVFQASCAHATWGCFLWWRSRHCHWSPVTRNRLIVPYCGRIYAVRWKCCFLWVFKGSGVSFPGVFNLQCVIKLFENDWTIDKLLWSRHVS